MTSTTEDQEDIDYLAMSDDELDNIVPTAAVVEKGATEEESKGEPEKIEETFEGGKSTEDIEDNSTGSEDKTETPETVAPNFEEEFNKLITPFKANGKEMKVNSVEEARTLMMMGANYNKKMAGLKPSLRVLKTLENNGLLDEDKLNFLIDLDKKDPSAINKLLKESGINPLDLDTEEAATYKPKAYNASDREVELDAVLDEIRDTEAFKDTIDIVSNKWDVASRRVLVENPTIIKAINDHVSAGIYEQITTRVERERMLGKLNGVSDIAAYKQVGDAMQAAGEFNSKESKPAVSTTVQATPQKSSNIDKKKAAGSTVKVGKTTKSNQEFNPLALSDEEFAKLSESNFS